jgi:hypothetical protein
MVSEAEKKLISTTRRVEKAKTELTAARIAQQDAELDAREHNPPVTWERIGEITGKKPPSIRYDLKAARERRAGGGEDG